MTVEEASENYGIPVDVLNLYESWGLCGDAPRAAAALTYDDRDLECLGTIMALRDTGFENAEIETYMRLLQKGCDTEYERLCILNRKRGDALDAIHFKEKQLERLDYLRHEIRKAARERRRMR